MSLINVNNLTFSYDGALENVFENVSFQIDTDWRLGFTGRNGRGKTTFLNLLLGKYEYGGVIDSSTDFVYFPFEVKDLERMTADVLSAVCPTAAEWEILREISLLGVATKALYRPFRTLSDGERTKCLLAALFLDDGKYRLLDEPTNHLDAAARERLGEYLKTKRGFLLVSHDRKLLDACADRILSINKTNIEITRGNFSVWLENKERKDNFEFAENERIAKDIERLKTAAARTADWSDRIERSKIGSHVGDRGYIGHKAAKMAARSKATEKRLDAAAREKSKLLKNVEQNEDLKLRPLTFRGRRVAEFSDVSVFYGNRAVAERISFAIEPGDRINISGKNGSGKSTLLKLLVDGNLRHTEMPKTSQTSDLPRISGAPQTPDLSPTPETGVRYTGGLYIPPNLKISFVPQGASRLSGTLDDYAGEYGIDVSLFKTILSKLNFSRAQFEKDIADFSDGQKRKVLISRSLCEEAHLYIWDEPLNFIDVLSRIQIENLVSRYEPTLIFVEHDRTFCEKTATKFIAL
ncbi:MAG: ATP-binding cassette domain-containing protein [Clostridiales bacterium]|jgi:lincosamide and streptogramin A transport system ATP-binding/permease protein|nr:ATP-binding cassette domain-containing protein [Clostridiales bacterium]